MIVLDPLAPLDWAVIALFFVVTLGLGLYFSRRASASMDDYFVAGRKISWWVAGTSIVATSFAADTPLVISGWMRTIGLERNWFWWGGIMGMMLCTFFFARLWRRAKILTDVEFNELRYTGKPAAGLRAFHASYRALIQNTLVMGWVTLAMTKIMDVTLNIPTFVFVQGDWLPHAVAKGVEVATVIDPATIAYWPIIGLAIIPAKATGILVCLSVAAIYSSLSGLWGVLATDVFQFVLAMTGTILLMCICYHVAGGASSLVEQAQTAVRQGIVINGPVADRTEAPDDESYVRAGLVEQRDDGWGWSTRALGLTEKEIVEQLGEPAADHPQDLVESWRKAFTISHSVLTDFGPVKQLVDRGFLVQDLNSSGKPLDYLRLRDPAITEDELRATLDEAGITNQGEILSAWRGVKTVSVKKITSFLPPFDLKGGGLLAVWSLVVFLGLQWWVGGEGGGFLAQRLFSCRNEKESVLAMLWFNFLNFAVRPWPWIIVGVASIFLIPDITAYGSDYDPEHAYVVMVMKYMPIGLKGLMVASLMAAYMSTISTHVNFGASYVINDLYKRFVHPGGSEKSDILVSRLASIFLALLAGIYAFFSSSISTSWFMMFELMSGTGFVILLRWYWWRINAWSELSAMFSSLLLYALMNWTRVFHGLFEAVGAPVYLVDEYAVRFTLNIFCTTLIWLTVTFLTNPVDSQHLVRFYQRIRPPGWWASVARQAGNPHHISVGWIEWCCWALGVTGLFALLIGLGKASFGQYGNSAICVGYAAAAAFVLFKLIGKMDWTGVAPVSAGEPTLAEKDELST